jgi:alanine racemase
MALRALAEVNLAAIERNVASLRRRVSGRTALCAVVKADGYGHGAAAAARAALDAGAARLAVATAGEALELRQAGISGPVLVLGAISAAELPAALAAEAELVAWDRRFVSAVTAAVAGGSQPVRLHVKLDTGLGRLGTRDPDEALAVAEAITRARPALQLYGAMTHFATADGELEFVGEQLRAFTQFVARVKAVAPSVIAHAANSAATIRVPDSHLDMVRCGIAVYGADPMNDDPRAAGLEPALTLSTYVAAVKRARAGESAGYGRRFVASRPTWLATLPIGYGDGVARGLSNNCDVLIGGRRYPLAGTVSMDNITVDLGPETSVAIGDRATLIGEDRGRRQTAEDLARRLGTINYEVLCGISRRVPRSYHRDGAPA